MAVRVAIREQLAILVVLAVLVGLTILSVPVWIYVNRFVTTVEGSQLALTASLKASRISSELELIQTSCHTVSSRLLLQRSLYDFYNGNDTETNWAIAKDDIESALGVGSVSGLLQARIYSRNETGDTHGLVNVTSTVLPNIPLPYDGPNGSPATLSDTPEGYPPQLYPNITYRDLDRPSRARPQERAVAAEAFPGVRITMSGGLMLGPLVINETLALMSISIPIRDQKSDDFIIGYMTMVFSASSLLRVIDSREGLGDTGIVLLIGPDSPSNRFIDTENPPQPNETRPFDAELLDIVPVKYALPPEVLDGQSDRHSHRTYDDGMYDQSFKAKDFPAVYKSFAERFSAVNNASSILSTHNEQDVSVAVGFARTNTPLVNWTVVVEQAKSEADAPIDTLRNIILGCVFGTAGLIIILIFPCAHLSVMPIRKLKAATEKTVAPRGFEDSDEYDEDSPISAAGSARSQRSKKEKGGFIAAVRKVAGYPIKEYPEANPARESARRSFKIPGKVQDRKHFITDELTELTQTFNDMSDELVRQYESLDDKVATRTRELELSKKAAEAANESKTLFIANISHELKTPLNGILGMCAVCMEENDLLRIKQSLKTLYKSGDLLLHLLEDLLSFSKNQIGQQLSLDQKEFRLVDIRTQVLSIFDKQRREGGTTLSVNFLDKDNADANDTALEGLRSATDFHGSGRLRDMCLWGDQHRILQVIINLVSNSLKFTPPGGKVEVRIRCVGEADAQGAARQIDDSRTSSFSRDSRRVGRSRQRQTSSSIYSASSQAGSNTSKPHSVEYKGTALTINPANPKTTPHVQVRERSPTPPPPGAKPLLFEFEVEDTGPGIPESMQQSVFEPFVQGDLGLSKKYGGTGLGLSICHQLAQIMGGSITLKSKTGVGTTFTMKLPLRWIRDKAPSTASSSVGSRQPSLDTERTPEVVQATPITKAAAVADTAPAATEGPEQQTTRLVGLRQPFFPADPKPTTTPSAKDHMAAIGRAMANKSGSGKLRVLVADDNSTNIEVVSKMLKLEDVYDVTIAKDGQEAYDLVKANMDDGQGFDVIFMDVQMPNLDGLQSTKLIREMGYKAPIVALTAFSEESNVKECMESGMDEFLSKPIRRPALKQVLKKFATIPEEPETPAQTPPDERPDPSASVGAGKSPTKQTQTTTAGAVKVQPTDVTSEPSASAPKENGKATSSQPPTETQNGVNTNT